MQAIANRSRKYSDKRKCCENRQWNNEYLIFVKFVIDEFVRSLLLEGDDDEGDEDVDEEERKDDEVNDVKHRHLHAEVGLRTLVLVRRIHGVDQHPAIQRTYTSHCF